MEHTGKEITDLEYRSRLNSIQISSLSGKEAGEGRSFLSKIMLNELDTTFIPALEFQTN